MAAERLKRLALSKPGDAGLESLPFTRFVEDVLRVELTSAQRVLCQVAFDGLEPAQLVGADRELARRIFGELGTIPPEARHVLAALCGARAGKSYLLGGLRLLHLAFTVPLTTLAPGELAVGIVVAPDTRLARQTLRYAAGAVLATPALAARVEIDSADVLRLRRPDGRTVDLCALPATRGGSAVRGRSLVGAVLDEACFFRDSDYVVNDTEVFKAVAPRVLPGGQVVIASTPWTEAGLLFELFTRNHGHSIDAISAHAPTTLLRDDERTRGIVARERERDPDNAAREFDAVPMSGGTSEFFDPHAILACIDDTMPLVLEPGGGCAALDTAFRKDASAEVIVRSRAKRIEVAECVEIKVPPGERLVPSVTLERLLQRARYHRCTSVAYDQHYAELVAEHAKTFMRREAPAGVTGKTEMYLCARALVHEGKVSIPGGNRRLIQQLRQVVSKPTSGGQLTISSPRRAGAHGDLASAFVLGCWVEGTHGKEADFHAKALDTFRALGLSG